MLMSCIVCIEWIITIGTILGAVANLRDKGVDFETGIMNRKSAVLRDKRGEHGKEEEDGREAGRRMTASNPSSSPLPWSCWLSCIVLRLSAD